MGKSTELHTKPLPKQGKTFTTNTKVRKKMTLPTAWQGLVAISLSTILLLNMIIYYKISGLETKLTGYQPE